MVPRLPEVQKFEKELEQDVANGKPLEVVIRVEKGQLEAGRRLVNYIYTARTPPVRSAAEVTEALDMLVLAEEYEVTHVRKRCTRALESVQPGLRFTQELVAKVKVLAETIVGDRGVQNLLALIQEAQLAATHVGKQLTAPPQLSPPDLFVEALIRDMLIH